MFLGFNTIISILIYWGISYFLILTVFYLTSKNFLYSIVGFIAILSNLSTFDLFRFVWTELGYSVILVMAVFSLYKYHNCYDKKFKILFLISIALLPIQRYIGAYISLYLGLIYLFLDKKHTIKRGLELSLTLLPIIIAIRVWRS